MAERRADVLSAQPRCDPGRAAPRFEGLPAGIDRSLAAGEHLFRTGDLSLGLIVVRRGALELRRVSFEGRIAVLRRAGPGDTFAEAALFEPHHHCDGVAAVPSLVTIHPAAAMRRAAAEDPSLAWRIAAHLAARLVAERARSERLALPHAADRLLDVLHAVSPRADGVRRIGGTWKSLAADLGLSHEATYRALARLERAGVLKREGRYSVRLAPLAEAE